MKIFRLFVLCLLLPNTWEEEEDDCRNFSRLSYDKPGNLTITGIFDEYTGENCSVGVDFGVELTSAAVWTVTALERHNYLPGIKIGLSVFDGCTTAKMAQEAFAEAIIRESCLNDSNVVGTITTPEIDAKLSSLKEKLNRTITRLEHVMDLDGLVTIVAELLTNLRWTTVNRVIADTNEVINSFSMRMSDEGICVYDEALSTDKYGVNNVILKPLDSLNEEILSKDSPVIVLLSQSQRISTVFAEMTPEMRKISAKWLIVPTDFFLNFSAEDDLPDEMYSVLPLVEKKDSLLKFLTDEEMQKDHMNHREATRSPLFLQTAVGILELLKPFKAIHERHCRDSVLCPELTKLISDLRDGSANVNGLKSVTVTPTGILNALNVLKIDMNENEPFLYIASPLKRDGRTEDGAIFQVFDVKNPEIKPVALIVNERLFNEGRSRTKRSRIFKLSVDDVERVRMREEIRHEVTEPTFNNDFPPFDKHPCANVLAEGDNNLTRSCGVCQNFIRFYLRSPRPTIDEEVEVEEVSQASWSWRFRTWVAINASIASIGIICTLAVTVFIIVRLCRGDILEGSPHFSFLILLSIILLYVSTLPFSLDETKESVLICRLKIISPSIGYAFLFSVILSRSAMLVISERDGGIMNHVNGCLQTILCFFMCIVQIALSIQFYVHTGMEDFDCTDIHVDHKFITLLAYDFFLLLLLAIAAPFTMRSKRNYREGTSFSISTLLVITVWSAWITLYRVLPSDDRDAAVALGLTATATAVLLSVFIPRTYLMATAAVRDKIANNLPNLAYVNASNISEINYRSNQALCDSVTVKYGTPKLGFSNPRIYSIHLPHSAPSSPSNFPMDGPDYVLNRRKTFIEISRAESPENLYDTQESQDMTGKITRF